ncbi:MAG: hypothetical protein H0U69_12780 [Trueperaceae bacterium]|nr:hypothetical protein [Trueperaceae bacterium]
MQGLISSILLSAMAPLSALADRSASVAPGAVVSGAVVSGAVVSGAVVAGAEFPLAEVSGAAPRDLDVRLEEESQVSAPAAESVVLAPHRADPDGLRVVPYRPDPTWNTARRIHPRVYDPFRAFPKRAQHLGELMYGDERRPRRG